jgi:serine/threonine-protein kinase
MAHDRICTTCGERYAPDTRFCARDGTALGAYAPPPSVGDARVLDGRWRLGERVGEGGLATVYRGEHVALKRPVAVKLVTHAGPDGAARLLREGAVIARLSHPNVVELIEVGRLPDGGAYLVLDWVEGRSLKGVLRERDGRVSLGEALAVAGAVARALAAAHAMGILHRDVKPENVMVPRRGDGYAFAQARLADFGVQGALETTDAEGRQTTRAGFVVGTPAYMAPEQLLGAPQTTATDLFGLGALLYELLFGTTIAGNATGGEVLLRRLREDVVIPDAPALPRELRALLGRLLDRESTHRPQSAAEVAATLDALGARAETAPPAPRDAVAGYAPVAPAPAAHTPPARSAAPVAAHPAPASAEPSARRSSLLAPLAVLALAALAAAAGLLPRGAPAITDAPWGLALQPLVAALAGIALFAGITRLIDRRRTALLAESAGVDASVQRALFGGLPLDREGISRTIATTVEAIIQQCRSLDEHLIGQTIVAIAREYGSEASTPDSRMAALAQIPQQLERLQQRIAARTTPWYVRHEKLLAALVSGTTILGGLAKTAIDVAKAAEPSARP